MGAGRKRAFDKAEALDMAMRVFWDSGYAGTSISDLTSALGISKPSLYAAFGNKEQLFNASMKHYMERYGTPVMHRLTHPPEAPLTQRLIAYLTAIIDLATDKQSPKGCLFVKSSCESDSAAIPPEVTASLQAMGVANEQFLVNQLKIEQQAGRLPGDTPVKELAAYLISVVYGLSVQARHGKSRKLLRTIAGTAVKALPVAAQGESGTGSM